MENFLKIYNHVDTNIFLSLFTLFTFCFVLSKFDFKEKYFKYMCITYVTIILDLLFESVIYNIVYLKISYFENSLNALYTIYYMFTLFILFAISTFLYNFIYKDMENSNFNIKLHNILFAIPLYIAFIMLIANLKHNYLFYMNEYSIIFKYNFAYYLICLISYGFINILRLLKCSKELKISELALLVTLLLIFVTSPFQQYVYNPLASNVKPGAIIAILFLIEFQDKLTSYDFLTMAFTRVYITNFIENLLKKHISKFSLIFIDLDDFKSINDNFGHNEGDIALCSFVDLIKSTLEKDYKLARYGGDEFIIYIPTDDIEKVETLISKINNSFIEYNSKIDKPYNLKFSYGYDAYDPKMHSSLSQFIHIIDKRMYQNKLNKKEANPDFTCLKNKYKEEA